MSKHIPVEHHPWIVEAAQQDEAAQRAAGRLKNGTRVLIPSILATFPLLIRYAQRGSTLTYEQVDHVVSAGTPRRANVPFGAIQRLLRLIEDNGSPGLKSPIPDITSIVRHKHSDTSGTGAYKDPQASSSKNDEDVERRRKEVFAYSDWSKILNLLGLPEFLDLTPQSQELMTGADDTKA